MEKSLLAASLSLVLLHVVPAQAQGPDQPTHPATGDQPHGVREHDGFYLRAGLGFGAFNDHLNIMNDHGYGVYAGTVSGVATTSELLLGGTPVRRFVVGGGVFSASVLVSDFDMGDALASNSDPQLPREVDSARSNFSVIGPFVNYYVGAVDGLHMQAALGVAMLTGVRYEQARFANTEVAVGAGGMLGVGKEWWIADQWGIGILGRFTGGVLMEEDNQGVNWAHWVATWPSVLITATYN
jgi:hypothetical protein